MPLSARSGLLGKNRHVTADDPRHRPGWPRRQPSSADAHAAPGAAAPHDPGHSPRPRAADASAHAQRGDAHPGMANYPAADHAGQAPRDTSWEPPHRGAYRSPLPPLDPPAAPRSNHSGGGDAAGYAGFPRSGQGADDRAGSPGDEGHGDDPPRRGRRGSSIPRKITVTRVAAMRSRQLTAQGIATVRRAANADGADESGLTALIWAYMANFACDAALTVALANTLFFSAATGESKTKVALYLLVTLAPFAVIAPLIGPALDRIQRGRRIALAASYGVRVVLAIILALNFDSWVLYPAALGMLVMSKSFAVLKSAVTPRLLPPEMDLVRVNSRLQIFGLVGGTTVAGAIAGVVAFVAGSPGALWLTALFAAGGAYLSMRIPSWVEVTEGEIATTFTYHGTPAPGPGGIPAEPPGRDGHPAATRPFDAAPEDGGKRRLHLRRPRSTSTLRQPLGHNILTGLWGTGTVKVLIGFLFLYIPFVAKAHADEEGLLGLILTGAIAVAAGGGNIAGNAVGARLKLRKPATVIVGCTAAAFAAAAFAAGTHVLLTVAIAALVGNVASALSKVSLDAAIQQDLPDRSRASAFGRSETILQLSWVLGGALGVLLPTDYWVGFTVISCILAVGLVQTALIAKGRSIIPAFRGRRPDTVAPEVAGGGRSTTRSTR